ncbi:Xylose isomerase-like TIM barrel [Aureimonas jatrophae]|uniref:Xylose isomerase-like TIM barrel n=2 Tax=Aureimonas jatrophae TaxID=1166073 RepID=A0A1H0EG63_9HYPH|nr:Xylose isomerase-like TIM barrel [Aureimonas jatrophae]
MQVVGLCRTPFLVGVGTPKNLEGEIVASIEMAAALGAPVVTIVTGGTEPGTKGLGPTWDRFADRLSHDCERAASCGVKLGLEPLNTMFGGNRTCLFSVADAFELCRGADAPNLGIAVDVYHVWWDSRLSRSLSDAGDLISGYHLCDWLADTSSMLLDRGMMGDGVVDLRDIRDAVENAGYRGLCEVEVFSSDDW